LAKERTVVKSHIKKQLPAILQENLLSRPLFVSWLPENEERLLKQRYPFDFSIPLPLPNMVPSPKLLRSQVSKCLKSVEKVELRWLLLARWLRDEGVCEPTDLLPKKVLDHLVTQFKKKNAISATDVYYSRLIDNWLPYFERLLTDLGKTPEKLPRKWLKEQGHDPSAIDCVFGVGGRKRSGVLFVACEWLTKKREDISDIKKDTDARTLLNAYIRMHGRSRLT